MGMSEYEQAVKIIAEHPELALFVGPRDPALVEKAEARLGLAFPPTYRRFLLDLGTGGFGSFEIYGVTGSHFEVGRIPNMVWLALRDREDFGMPNRLIPIHEGGDGELDCLDTGAGDGGEAPVIAYDPGVDPEARTPVSLASDFGSFILGLVREQIQRGLDPAA